MVPAAEYHDRLEAAAWEVVGKAYDEYGDDLRGTAQDGPALQRAIVDLANMLRTYHYQGDGCLDEHGDA